MPASTDKENATARVTLLMTPTEKKALFAQAKSAGFDSVGAYIRERAFGPDSPELDALVDQLNASTQRAKDALDHAIEAVNASMQSSGAREHKAREDAMREWKSWTPAQQAAVRALCAATDGDEQ